MLCVCVRACVCEGALVCEHVSRRTLTLCVPNLWHVFSAIVTLTVSSTELKYLAW